jgi:hypothetical protein
MFSFALELDTYLLFLWFDFFIKIFLAEETQTQADWKYEQMSQSLLGMCKHFHAGFYSISSYLISVEVSNLKSCID